MEDPMKILQACLRTLMLIGLTAVLLLTPAARAKQLRCIFCGSTVDVKLLHYRDGYKPVCLLCREKLPRCSLCGLPTNLPPYRDGRYICASCRATGVFTQAQLAPIYAKVQQFVKTSLGGMVISPAPPAEVVDQDEIQTRFTASGRSMDVDGFYRPYNPEQIYILSGQTKVETGAVLAHEYTHAWQSRNCPLQDRALTEGFATWVQYKYYVAHGDSREAIELTRNPDPDYGASLLELLALEKKVGPAGVIEFARTRKRL